MSEYPLVSTVIPTYGGSASLERAINSVLQQSYPNHNLIVVDDNSPDSIGRQKTELIMDKFSMDNRVIYIQHPYNKNGAAARNTGVAASKSKYICLLDDDDVFLPDKLKHQVEYLETNRDYQACYCWRRQYGKEICGTEIGDLSKSLLDLSFTPTTSAIMITKEAYDSLNGFDESYRRHQDYEFLLRFFKNYKMGYVPYILLEFLGNEIDNQVYGKKLYNLKITFFERFAQIIDDIDSGEKGFKRTVYASHFSTTNIQLIRKGNFVLAFKLYFKYGIKGGFLYWKLFCEKIFSGLLRRI